MIQVGAAASDITPDVGVWQAGFASRSEPSNGVHSPLFTRAFVFSDGDRAACLVTNDLVGLARPEILKIRQRAVERCPDLNARDIMITCTHTHSGPTSSTYLRGQPVEVDYLRELCGTVADTIATAAGHLQPAHIAVAETEVEGFNHNRRDESKYCEKRLAWLEARNESGETLAGIVNFTAHPTMHTGLLLSGDYAGVLAHELQAKLDAPVGVINGCHGNINATPRAHEDTSVVDDHGQRLAAETLGIRKNGRTIESERVRTAAEMVHLTFGKAQPRATYREIAADQDQQDYVREWAQDVLEKYPGDPVEAVEEGEVMVIGLGEAAIVGIPGHAFAEIGRDIANAVSDRWLMIANHANDYLGYFGTREAHEEGGYELERAYRFNSSFPWAMDADTTYRIQDAAIRLARA